MKAATLTTAMIVCVWAPITHGNVFNDFEDGDYTSNPTWAVLPNPSVAGEAVVDTDPIRLENLVLRGHGDETGHHSLTTPATILWTSLDMSMEILTLDNDFNPALAVFREPAPGELEYSLNIRVRREPTWAKCQPRIVEYPHDAEYVLWIYSHATGLLGQLKQPRKTP